MNTGITIGVLIACTVLARLIRRKRHELPLPPGPPADPIIGHLRLLPDVQNMAEVFQEWSQKYGDVFSLRVPGKTIIVLGSEQAAFDLLEKRSAIYSDRARLGYYEAVGWGDAIIFARYGPFHTRQRKLYHDGFGKNAVSQYCDIQQREANILLKGFLDEPKNYDRHIQRFSGATVAEIGYGHRIKSFDDEYFTLGEKLGKIAGEGSIPSLLDIHPVFKHLPSWVPGAWFVDFLKETQPFMDGIILGIYQEVEKQIENGTAKPSFTSQHLEAMHGEERDPEDYRALRMAAGMMFAAGFETTWHAIAIFLAAMLLHPEAQRKAHEELDRVVGRDRLPELSDRESLPYIQCVVHESMRWNPITPIGLPHQATVDDTYRGMRIPKDAIVIANARGLTWDENKFHDARSFKPERFLPKPEGAGEIFPVNAVYGWGRRICAGRFLAENLVWIAMATILAVYDITPLKDAEGRPLKPKVKFTTKTTRHVEPIECDILPRDEKARLLILNACRD